MRIRTFGAALAVLTTLALGACSVVGGEAAKEPPYTVVRADAPFEIRDYGELVIVKTAMQEGSRGAFGKLFDYISGANSGKREIAMTAPVLRTDQDQGAKIAMTAPVLQTRDGQGDMIFVLPEEFDAETAPLPTDPTVKLETIAPRRVAVVRFSGSMDDAAVAEQRAALLAWMDSQGLTPAGPAQSAGYNPPWTVPALRRNEVLVPIDPASGG
ncbi:MAG: heme-binding protein [Pseudomonadota bacterium]